METRINGKANVFKSVQPPPRATLAAAGEESGRQWESVARGMVSEVAEQLDRQAQARTAEATSPPEPRPIEAPKPAPAEKTYAYLDINDQRKPIMINQGDDLQLLANAQQRVVIGVHGTRETFYKPRPPKQVLIFTESISHIRTQINAVETPSARFQARCEDYADKYQVKVVAVFPDGEVGEYPPMSSSDRASQRLRGDAEVSDTSASPLRSQRTMSGCRRCGSVTCAGVGSTGIRCRGKGGRK